MTMRGSVLAWEYGMHAYKTSCKAHLVLLMQGSTSLVMTFAVDPVRSPSLDEMTEAANSSRKASETPHFAVGVLDADMSGTSRNKTLDFASCFHRDDASVVGGGMGKLLMNADEKYDWGMHNPQYEFALSCRVHIRSNQPNIKRAAIKL